MMADRDDNDIMGLGGVGGNDSTPPSQLANVTGGAGGNDSAPTPSQLAIAASHRGGAGGPAQLVDDSDADIDDRAPDPGLAETPADEPVRDATQDAVDAAYARWLAQRELLPGWCTYTDAYALIVATTGQQDQRQVHQQLAGVPMRAHHWHMQPQSVAPSMLFDPVWRWNVERNTVHKATTPDYPEHRLWLEVDRTDLEERLGLHPTPQRRPIPTRVAGQQTREQALEGLEPGDPLSLRSLQRYHLRRHGRDEERGGEDALGELELECRICEVAPDTDVRDLSGLPPGWFALGTLHGRLLACCGPCKTLLRRALTRKET